MPNYWEKHEPQKVAVPLPTKVVVQNLDVKKINTLNLDEKHNTQENDIAKIHKFIYDGHIAVNSMDIKQMIIAIDNLSSGCFIALKMYNDSLEDYKKLLKKCGKLNKQLKTIKEED